MEQRVEIKSNHCMTCSGCLPTAVRKWWRYFSNCFVIDALDMHRDSCNFHLHITLEIKKFPWSIVVDTIAGIFLQKKSLEQLHVGCTKASRDPLKNIHHNVSQELVHSYVDGSLYYFLLLICILFPIQRRCLTMV